LIPEHMVHSIQAVHLSCSITNTVSKWTEARFYMMHLSCIIWNLASVYLEIVLVSVQDRCTVCTYCTIG